MIVAELVEKEEGLRGGGRGGYAGVLTDLLPNESVGS